MKPILDIFKYRRIHKYEEDHNQLLSLVTID
jgi:hypothetical protein